MNFKRNLKWGALIGIIAVGGISLGTFTYISKKVASFNEVFAQGVIINDTDVGGMTKETAKEQLEKELANQAAQQVIIIKKGDIEETIPFSEIGIQNNLEETLDKAFEVGHTGSLFEKYEIAKSGLSKEETFDVYKSYDKDSIQKKLNEIAEHFYTEPINAAFTKENGQFVITKEVAGEQLDIETTTDDIIKTIESENSQTLEVEATLTEVAPAYTEADFLECQNLIASFSTSYNNSDLDRNANLEVAAKKISRMLLPEEEFSLATQLEPFTTEEGYRNSKVIVNGKIELGIGGGVCQVASTLYNAILLTDLEVVQRQNHSLPVAYVPLGRDATYATGSIDFKFKNNTGHPIYIDSYCQNNKVIVNIYAHNEAKSIYDIKFESVVTEVIPAPETQYVEDSTLEAGQEVVETSALDGKKVQLYKYYYQNGELVNKELVNNSTYKARAAVIRKGPEKEEEKDKEEDKEEGKEEGEVEEAKVEESVSPSPSSETLASESAPIQ